MYTSTRIIEPIMEGVYCRFCAERKRPENLLNLLEDPDKLEEIKKKINTLHLSLFDTPEASLLPKTVCLVCVDSLKKACEFSNNFRKAQSTLFRLCLESSDNNEKNYNFNAKIVNPVNVYNRSIKPEKDFKNNEKNAIFITKQSTSIKIEINIPENSHQSAESEDSSNIFDTTICNLPQTGKETTIGPLYGNIPIFKFDYKKKFINNWKDYPWHCIHCYIECSSLQKLRKHMKKKHDTCGGFTCADCKDYKIYDGFFMFVSHVRSHWQNLRDICPHCDIKSDDINDHDQEHLTKPTVICPACGEIQPNEEALNAHKNPHITKPKLIKKRRKRGSPITKEELTCEFCQKVYKSLNSVREHRKLHTRERTKDYTCDRCGKIFYNKGTLTTHILAHDQVKRHTCKICNKSFLFKTKLRRHIGTHSGEKPFSCEECGRCFRLQCQLNKHKVIHTDSMPYSCQFCTKTFRFKVNLQNHERQHTGARPYVCDECNMEFTNWSNHNKHMKRRHGKDTSKKKITPEGTFSINPETGKIVEIDDKVDYEEWKNEVMIPCKRGKKKL